MRYTMLIVIIIGMLIIGYIYLQIFDDSIARATVNGAAQQFCIDRNMTLSINQSWNFNNENIDGILNGSPKQASGGSYIVCASNSIRYAISFCEEEQNYMIESNSLVCKNG